MFLYPIWKLRWQYVILFSSRFSFLALSILLNLIILLNTMEGHWDASLFRSFYVTPILLVETVGELTVGKPTGKIA